MKLWRTWESPRVSPQFTYGVQNRAILVFSLAVCSKRQRLIEPKTSEFILSGTVAAPIGITNPPIDDLLNKADSKYALVIYAAKRARQINAYYSQLHEGLLEYVGPLVDTRNQEKPLSIALREINEGLLTIEQHEDPEDI